VSSLSSQTSRKTTISEIVGRKREGVKIVAITAYDYPTSLIADRSGVDIILVGDSGGMVALGYEDTRPVSMEEMLMMAKAVSRGARRALLVGDMPFMSYQTGIEEGIRNAGRFIKEGGMDAVKIEGGREFVPLIRTLSRVGIPVMAHIGFTPQTTPTLEGYRVQGKTAEETAKLIDDAVALAEAGAFSVVLEMTTVEAAKAVTDTVRIPTIGIGAGPFCDGQILVLHDVLGLFDRFTPKFARKYLNLSGEILKALQTYREDILQGHFPGEQHSFHMDVAEIEKLHLRTRQRD